MWRLAFGVYQGQCDAGVTQDAPDNFPCYDMASSQAVGGDFVADGEVNLFDLSLQIRMLYGGIDIHESYMRISNTQQWKYNSLQDCSRRRERRMAASIVKTWSVSCPNDLSSCYYASCRT